LSRHRPRPELKNQGREKREKGHPWDAAHCHPDADRDKVWLFAKDKTAGAKRDLYFEMKDAIQTESFDPAKLRPVNVEGRAKLLLEYLPLIGVGAK
jgi:hypothetical protein